MKPLESITLGLFFAMEVSTAKYLLVEIEEDVKSEIPENAGSLINFQIGKLPIQLTFL